MDVVMWHRSGALNTVDRSVERSRKDASPKEEWPSTHINQSDVMLMAQLL
jgi:hypothetical protein